MIRRKMFRNLSALLASVMIVTSPGVAVMAAETDTEQGGIVIETDEETAITSDEETAFETDTEEISEPETASEESYPETGKNELVDEATNFTFELKDDGTAEITGYNHIGSSSDGIGNLNIPGTVKLERNGTMETVVVTEIAPYAFQSNTFFTGSLTIPDSVTMINAYAFDGCVNLTGSLIIPDSVTYIGFYAFRECYGMDGQLYIGKNVTDISGQAFFGCKKLKGDITIPAKVERIGDSAFQGCTGFTGHLTFEGEIFEIGKNAFSGLNITGGLTFPGHVGNILERAFYECKQLNGPLVFSEGVGFIGNYAFAYCEGLTGNVYFDNVTIKDNSFKSCKNLGPILTLGKSAYWDDSMGMYSHSFLYCSGIKKVVNGSTTSYTLSSLKSDSSKDGSHSWKDAAGNTIFTIANGTAYRDDYDPSEEKPAEEDEEEYYSITMMEGAEAYDSDDYWTDCAKEGDVITVQWLYEGEDLEFVRWETKNKGVKFEDPYDEETTFIMPAEDVVINFVEKKAGADEPDPEPAKCPPVVVKQKINLYDKEYFGGTFNKNHGWVVEPKQAASVSKGILTAKKAGEVTITRRLKVDGKFDEKYDEKITIMIYMPAYQKDAKGKDIKTTTIYRMFDTVKSDDMISCGESGPRPTKYECSDKKGKNFVMIDEDTGEIQVIGNGSCKITLYYGDIDRKYATKYPYTIKAVIPTIKASVTVNEGKKKDISISKVQKGLTPQWRALDYDPDAEEPVTASSAIEIVSISKNSMKCTIKGIKKGETNLVAYVDGISYICEVTVK